MIFIHEIYAVYRKNIVKENNVRQWYHIILYGQEWLKTEDSQWEAVGQSSDDWLAQW